MNDSHPLCESCNHCHAEGVKCGVCGHLGRSMIYPRMRARALERRSVRSHFYDGAEFFGANSLAMESTWDLLVEARLSAYYNGGSMAACNKDNEFVPEHERLSKHYVMYAGDALISCGRYHISPLSGGKLFVSIDRFGVQTPYRGRGYAKKCLKEIIANAMKECNSHSSQEVVVGIQVPTTIPPVVADKLLSYGFVQSSAILVEERGGDSYVTLVNGDSSSLLQALSSVA